MTEEEQPLGIWFIAALFVTGLILIGWTYLTQPAEPISNQTANQTTTTEGILTTTSQESTTQPTTAGTTTTYFSWNNTQIMNTTTTTQPKNVSASAEDKKAWWTAPNPTPPTSIAPPDMLSSLTQADYDTHPQICCFLEWYYPNTLVPAQCFKDGMFSWNCDSLQNMTKAEYDSMMEGLK